MTDYTYILVDEGKNDRGVIGVSRDLDKAKKTAKEEHHKKSNGKEELHYSWITVVDDGETYYTWNPSNEEKNSFGEEGTYTIMKAEEFL